MSEETKMFYWEDEVYARGINFNRYPYDNVVSFIFKNFSRNGDRNETKILEVGSGAGNNLWFAAKEGFAVTGIDGSKSAVEYCKKRFAEEELTGEFLVGDFSKRLPFETNSFDLAVSRSAITCCGWEDAKKTVLEVNKVLKQRGRFFLNPLSAAHTSLASGEKNSDGTWSKMTKGALAGVERLYFFNEREIRELFRKNWKIISMKHKELNDVSTSEKNIHAEWEVTAEKL